jgi:hypothetical protein
MTEEGREHVSLAPDAVEPFIGNVAGFFDGVGERVAGSRALRLPPTSPTGLRSCP